MSVASNRGRGMPGKANVCGEGKGRKALGSW